MKPPLFAVLAAALVAPASAGTSGRVEVVPEFNVQSGLGASGVGVTPLTVTPLSLTSVLPIAAVSNLNGTPLAWPSAVSAAGATPLMPAAVSAKSVIPQAKPFQPAAKSAATEGERKTLIQTLSAPQIDASKLGTLESAGAAEADFMARAQLGMTRSAAAELPASEDFTTGATPAAAKLKKAAARLGNASDQAAALKSWGAREVLAAYESGALAQSHPGLAASLEKAGHDAMREAVSKAKFKERFLYGGVFGTYIYESEDLPGVILKVYRGPLDLLGLPSSASRGYALAKEKLGGLFAETTVLKGVSVEIEGKRRSFARVLVQELTETKTVKDWGKRAQATHEAMIRRGVRDTDTGPRAGFYDAHLARNLGETKDGRVVHFDADWFKTEKEPSEPGRRVPDPEPLRPHARAAQEALLSEYWKESAVPDPTLVDADGKAMTAALARLAKGGGAAMDLGFVPSPKSLKVVSELDHEVLLYRRLDGTWRVQGGERHAVADADEEYDLALHNHPHMAIGAQSVYTPYPTPEDLELSFGRKARFMVVSRYGVVEWNPDLPEGVTERLLATRWGRAVMRLLFPTFYPGLLARSGVAADLKPWKKVSQDWLENGEAPADERLMKEKRVPAWAREELAIVAAKLGKNLDAEGAEKVLARTNLWPYRWHSRWSYEVDGLPDGHHDPKFGIRLMLRTNWRQLKDPRAHFSVLFAHEYAHWLQNEKLLTYSYGIEIPAVAVEQLRAIELVGLEGIKAGKIGFMGEGNLANFESGRAWARGPMTEEMSLYHRGVLGGVAYEVGVIAGRPEAAWEFLRLVARETDRLSPRAAFKVVTGLDK